MNQPQKNENNEISKDILGIDIFTLKVKINNIKTIKMPINNN